MNLVTEQHPAGQPLFAHHFIAEIRSAHIFCKHRELIPRLCGYIHRKRLVYIGNALQFVIYKHLRAVAQLCECKRCVRIIAV